MPLTNDLTQVTAGGNINANLVAPSYLSIPQNTFWLNGCTDYGEAIDITLTMYKMRNKGYSSDTNTFSVYLYAIDPNTGLAYPIAKQESGI